MCICAIPHFVSAQLVITEIMYDVEGTDTKREWIEVHNTGNVDIDITGYKLVEAETKHSIKSYGTATHVPADGYAVLADSPTDVLESMADVLLFDSVFSLSNNGEELSLMDATGAVVDSVLYDVTLGATGDGMSLQLIDGQWIASEPSAGKQNKLVSAIAPAISSDTDADSSDAVSSSGSDTERVAAPSRPDVFSVDVTIPNIIIAGENTVFTAEASLGKSTVPRTRFEWVFGDGAHASGSTVTHTFDDTGEYVLYVEGISDVGSDTYKKHIHVSPMPISIVSITDTSILLANKSSFDIDVGRWTIISNGIFYTIPKHTYILPKGTVSISSKAIGMTISKDASLVSPSGVLMSFEKSASVTPVQKSLAQTSAIVSTGPSSSSAFGIKTADVSGGDVVGAEQSTPKTPQPSMWKWIGGLIALLSLGLVVLYFLQKKHTLIDTIDIIEEE